MRILFVSREYPPVSSFGGIATYVHTLGHALKSLGHQVHVLTTLPFVTSQDWHDDGVTVHVRRASLLRSDVALNRLHIVHSYRRLEGALAVRYFVKRLGRFDIVEVADWFGESLLLDESVGGRLVMQIHTPLASAIGLAAMPWTPDIRLASWLEWVAGRRMSRVVGPTRAAVDLAVRYWRLPEWKCATVPLPVAVPAIASGSAGATAPSVLFVGRLEPLKNPAFVVKLAARIIAQVPAATFWFAGSGDVEYVAGLRRCAESNGVGERVHFLGQRPPSEVAALRATTRLCVVPSQFESFSYAAAESLAAGRPVVAAMTGGLPEVVMDGITGYVIPLNDVATWESAIVRLLRDGALAERMGRAGRAHALSTFHPSVVARQKVSVWTG